MDTILKSLKIKRATERAEPKNEGIDEDTVDAAKAIDYLISRKPRRLRTNLATESDLRSESRSITIVTTAALPWMTGTAVNPILRAAHFARDNHNVMLVVPWVQSKDSQKKIFPGNLLFEKKEKQKEFIELWLKKNELDDEKLRIEFYDGVYSAKYGSVFPLQAITDIFAGITDFEMDVCVLEEPEHLNWHHPGSPWPDIFKIVIGVIHTNYIEYVRSQSHLGEHHAFLLMLLNIWVARSYCHRIIKLSNAVQFFPNSVTCNVHGVNKRYIDIGKKKKSNFDLGLYFMAKTLWSKGYANLLALLRSHYHKTNKALKIRFFGNGPDAEHVLKEIEGDPALANVMFEPEVIDHSSEELQRYKVYVNPSISEVVCTATAEALAMGKSVIIIKHDSNEFFESFENCHVFRNTDEFSELIGQISQKDPLPISDAELDRLSWKAATHRFYESAHITDGNMKTFHVDQALAYSHSTLSKIYPNPGETFRKEQGEEESDDSLAGELT